MSDCDHTFENGLENGADIPDEYESETNGGPLDKTPANWVDYAEDRFKLLLVLLSLKPPLFEYFQIINYETKRLQ